EIMLKALQKQPEFRFQSMAEFAAALRAESADVPAVSGINPIVDATMVLSFPTGSVSQPVPQGTAVLAMDSELSATAAQPTGGTQVHTTDGPQHVTAGTTGASPAATTSHTMQATTMGLHGSTAMQMVPVVQQRKILPIVLLTILGVALIGGALGAGLLLGGGSEAEPTTVAALPPAAVAAPAATKAAVNSPPEPNTKADPPPTVEAEPVPTEEPAVAAGSAGAAPPPADADADRTKAEPDTVSPSTPQVRRRTGAKPKSDAAVIANLKRRMAGKCTQDGNVQVRLEGLISSQGRIQGALATPRSGPGGCAEKILKSARFASRPDMKPMPIFTIKL
nr:hypothetical protein [Deltaproteobacteria bacterium]